MFTRIPLHAVRLRIVAPQHGDRNYIDCVKLELAFLEMCRVDSLIGLATVNDVNRAFSHTHTHTLCWDEMGRAVCCDVMPCFSRT